MRSSILLTLLLGLASVADGQSKPGTQPAPATQGATQKAPVAVEKVSQPFTGDFDAIVKRRMIRVLTPYSKTGYFVDSGVTRGFIYDIFKKFETELNAELKTGNLKVLVFIIPTPMDKLVQYLNEGKGDIVAVPAIITEQRQTQVDFTDPARKGVAELIVTGPNSGPVRTLDDLSGKSLFVAKWWAYWKDMEQLSARFVKEGKPPLTLIEAPDNLSTEDMLEMVNAGIVPATAAHDYIATFWAQVLPGLKVNKSAVVKTGDIAWAIRRNSPKLKAQLNAYLAKYPEGSTVRNMLLASYFKNTKFVKAATSAEGRDRMGRLAQIFQKYGDKYGLDYLLMAAQGYQESTLNQQVKSQVGAVGVMQVMPATGKQMNVGDISELEPNIHAGVKFIRFMMDQYYSKEKEMTELDKELFTFASYNAGPGRIAQLRKVAAARGLNPNIWFNNVEIIASEKIGRETVTYVGNIYKYYLGYRLLMEQREAMLKSKEAVRKKGGNP